MAQLYRLLSGHSRGLGDKRWRRRQAKATASRVVKHDRRARRKGRYLTTWERRLITWKGSEGFAAWFTTTQTKRSLLGS